jgi:hypothetical protein
VELWLLIGPMRILQMIHVWIRSISRMILTVQNWRTWRKIYPSVTLSTTNPTWTDKEAKLGLHTEKTGTNHICYGTALPKLAAHNENYISYQVSIFCIISHFSENWGSTIWTFTKVEVTLNRSGINQNSICLSTTGLEPHY